MGFIMITYQEWKREQESVKSLKALVDRICRDITEDRIRDQDHLAVRINEAGDLCCELFPDRTELFELVYKSRFKRLWEQFGPGERER